MTTYTIDQTLTALCIWEWMLEANRDDVKEYIETHGAVAARQQAITFAVQLEKAYETVKDDFDDAFDWEFVPAAMGLVEDWDTPIPEWPDTWTDRMLGAAILDAYEENMKNKQEPVVASTPDRLEEASTIVWDALNCWMEDCVSDDLQARREANRSMRTLITAARSTSGKTE